MQIRRLSWLLLSLCVCPSVMAAATTTQPVAVDNGRVAGLVGEYFKNVKDAKAFKAEGVKPYLVRTDKNINFKSVNGAVL